MSKGHEDPETKPQLYPGHSRSRRSPVLPAGRLLPSDAMPRYLIGYAEPEARNLAALDLPHDLGHAAVIPACGEGPELLQAIDSVPPGPLGVVLVLIVVNARQDHPESTHIANAETLARLAARAPEPPHRIVRVIDRASPGRRFPPKEGVGLARKLGHDVVLALHAAGRIKSRFQYATDADARLPGDFFVRLAAHETARHPPAGAVYPWRHVPDPDPVAARAIGLYDLWLRYHLLGLASAGSPFAYHAIGSTIAVSHAAYEVVRGFPRRMAGEDFYLLDKLAKEGWVARPGGAPITLAGRPSDRVPFGTGRSVSDMVMRGETAQSYRILHPRTYRMLAAWLKVMDIPPAEGKDLLAEVTRQSAEFGLDNREMGALLRSLHAMDAITPAAATLALPLTPANRRRRLHTGFDAFRSLKLLHLLRDDGWPDMPVADALRTAEFVRYEGPADPFDAATAARHLEQLEERHARGPAGLVLPRDFTRSPE